MSDPIQSAEPHTDLKILEMDEDINSQEWLSATLKSIADAVIATSAGADPRILFMNTAAEKLTGWSLEDARGRPALNTFPIINQKTREPRINPIQEVIRMETTVGPANETVLISKSGQEFVIEENAAPIRDKKGNLSGVVLVFRDVTAKALAEEKAKEFHKEVERAREDLQSFFMQCPIPMVILRGPEHKFVLANEPYERLVGRKVLGKKVLEAFTVEEVSLFKSLLDGVYQTGKPYIGKELPLRIPDEQGVLQDHFVNVAYYPFLGTDGCIQGVLSFNINVTDEVLARKDVEQGKAAVENERENFRNLFRLSPEMVCVLKGPDHVFEFVNEAHIKVLGFDATGKPVREAQPESVEVHGILDEVFRTGKTALLHEIPVTVGDRLRYFNLTYAARRDENANIDGIMILGSEITDQVLFREQLEASEAKFRELADALPQIIWTAGPDGYVDWYNAWWYKYLGRPQGTKWDDTDTYPMHPEDVAKTQILWYKAVAAGEPFHMEQRFKRGSDGQYRWHLVRGVPIKDQSGKVIRYVGANTDIHDQRMQADELKSVQTRLSLAMQSARISTWHVNLASKTAHAPKETAQLLGVEHLEGDVFQIIETMLHPDDRERGLRTLQEAIAKKTDYSDEFRIVKPDGEIRWLRAHGRVHEVGGQPFLSGISTDITEEKQRIRQLEEAKLQAEAASLAKSAFLANMSHEIRTPLGAIIGFSELLREPDLTEEEKRQYLDTIIRSGHGLTRIIDDVLDLAKVEAGKLDIEKVEFSLFDLMQEVKDLFKDKVKQKGIYLLLNTDDEVPQFICSDPTRLRQILINLIGNAVKFTSQGGVRVHVKSEPQGHDHAKITILVKDTGIGLTQAQKERIFQPFVQADNSTTRKYGGTGLGLELSRRLAMALGGNISILECQEGWGCTFALNFLGALPPHTIKPDAEKKTPARALPRLSGGSERLSQLKVLLADDSEDNQFLITRVLQKYGAEVEIANNGEEAIHKALASEFDLVLMDIQMPKVDGYEAARTLRKKGYQRPIVALTAHAMPEEQVRTRTAGCNGHLTKPLNQQELISTIELLTRRKKPNGIEYGLQ